MASGDTLVFDMSSMSEGTPSVFTKKDWLSILDNQNQSYQGNQSVIDTSQLANSNKFMNYREGYLLCPLLLTLTGVPSATRITAGTNIFAPATAASACDYAMGLKNWYGSIIHSLTLDYQGTTIIQQTPYIGMWNTFRLMTTLSVQDLTSLGPSIGFFPDTATSFGIAPGSSANAAGAGASGAANSTIINNVNNLNANPALVGVFNPQTSGNEGMVQRQRFWNFSPDGIASGLTSGALYSTIMSTANLTLLYKSYIFNKVNSAFTTAGSPAVNTFSQTGIWQAQVSAIILLRHCHTFFERVPLLKGVFLKLTLNLNQSSVSFTTTGADYTTNTFSVNTAVSSPLGGVSPIMIASAAVGSGSQALSGGDYIASIAVGKNCLNSAQTNCVGATKPSAGTLSASVLLYVPAYSFNPVFESSYLSSPVKKIIYSDVYQYQVLNIAAGAVYNNLVTNGIANIKSVLVLPYFNSAANGGLIPWQSPFDPAGAGPTSPLCLQTQFNIQISGQNAIYNTQRYSWEQFQNQFYGVNSINAGQVDGLTSGLVGSNAFDMEYCYYYVNCGRMLPVEEAVPKSVNILGQNTSGKAIDLYVFVEYGVEVSVDVLTGARV
jgi:hypothetical protein